MIHGLESVYWDNLIYVSRDPKTKRLYYQGKRVPKDCPINYYERRIYVEFGTITAIRKIKTDRNITIGEAKALLDEARGKKYGDHRYSGYRGVREIV